MFNLSQINPKKILLINIFGIGDVLFTTPLITNLKEAFPSIEIGYMCSRRAKDIVESNPNVNKIYIYERDAFVAIYKKSKIDYWKELARFWQTIKEEKYDVVIDVSLSSFASFFTMLIGIPHRVGLNYKNRSRWLNHATPLVGYENKHVVTHYLDLLRQINVPIVDESLKLYLSKEDQQTANQALQQVGIKPHQPWIALFPGGGASWGADARFKRWAPERFAALADKIIEKFSLPVILFGDLKEKELCDRVATSMKHKTSVVCEFASVRSLAATLKQSALVVVNDGGPLHVAVAAQAKTVSIFGPVDEHVYGPYPSGSHLTVQHENLACRPCYRRFRRASCDHVSCLNEISVEQVFHAVERGLNP